jgi:hypothetical protein
MASTNIKRIAGDAIAAYIAGAIPTLASVATAQAGPETNFPEGPSVRLMPQITTFEPSNADEVYYTDPDDGKLVYQVGDFTGIIQLELWTRTKPEREKFEQLILDLFLADPFAPGTLILTTPTLTIKSYVSLYSAELKVRLDQEDWKEEMSFESHRYTYLELMIDFPALTSVNAVTMTKIDVDFSSDFEAVITNPNQLATDDKIEVQIDGSTIQASS